MSTMRNFHAGVILFPGAGVNKTERLPSRKFSFLFYRITIIRSKTRTLLTRGKPLAISGNRKFSVFSSLRCQNHGTPGMAVWFNSATVLALPPRLASHEGHQGHEDTSILVFFVSFVVGAASCCRTGFQPVSEIDRFPTCPTSQPPIPAATFPSRKPVRKPPHDRGFANTAYLPRVTGKCISGGIDPAPGRN